MSKVDELKNQVAALDAKIASQNKIGNATPSVDDVFGTKGVPAIRTGESSMNSRGFRFSKLIGVVAGVIDESEAKVEMEVARKMQQHEVVDGGFAKQKGRTLLAPLSTDLLMSRDESYKVEMKNLVEHGVTGADPDEMAWIERKHYGKKTAQQWMDQSLGGSLVADPAQGELIELLRNKNALMNAGATLTSLPPQGRIKYPRQTTASTAYWLGEGQTISPTNVGTGFIELSAKKVCALITCNNELLRYASVNTEALLRSDMAKSLNLTLDYALLYGPGSDTQPLGLVNTPGVATVTPSDSSNTQLAPQDLFSFISAVEANNGVFSGWILRPEMFYDFCSARASTYNGSTTAAVGQFVYDQMRPLGHGFPKVLAGYNAVTTSQVSVTRGSGDKTTVFGGDFTDFVIAMFGGIEFAQAFQGDTAFANDQTVVRAILSADGAARHPGVYAIADGILNSVGV